MEKQYFSYIRVSTAKQGERGVSLQEQEGAILRYAERQNIHIAQSFQEIETAAKRGRPIFTQMLNLLKRGKANGVVIHKIDRGARNLKDWADLGELIDAGVEVHFANESLDLNTRGGRLSADIQAVVAADYIRNLREETRKGFYGRLKQGFYPLNAPLGYLDRGGGQAKAVDRTVSDHIRAAFELYATGDISLPRLAEEMYRRGLRNKKGGKVSLTGISTILNNSFYTGVIHIRKTSESFAGVHQAIVDQRTFEIVQRVLEGKTVVRTHRHEFAYSRMIRCALCGQTAMAEVQKSHTYYRCHTKDCATKTIRQERLEEAISQAFVPLRFSHDEIAYARRWFKWKRDHRQEDSRRQIEACNLQLAQIRDRMVRLTDAYIDGAIDKTLLDERRSALLMDEAALKQRIVDLESGSDATSAKLEKFLELVQTAQTLHKLTQPAEKRTLVKSLTSNLLIDRKNAAITLNSAAQLLANRPKSSCCALRRGVPRTFDKLLIQLEKMFTPPKERTLALAA